MHFVGCDGHFRYVSAQALDMSSAALIVILASNNRARSDVCKRNCLYRAITTGNFNADHSASTCIAHSTTVKHGHNLLEQMNAAHNLLNAWMSVDCTPSSASIASCRSSVLTRSSTTTQMMRSFLMPKATGMNCTHRMATAQLCTRAE